ncbi:efflux RND transporter permease subunit [Acinetobacter soli]|nr:efflux RND transporter permease subunit [Acinetobacter soli]
MRLTGKLSSVEDLKQLPILVGDKTIRLSDVAEVYRGFSEPAQPRMRFMGDNGIGIAVSMRKGGDIIALGKQLQQTFSHLQKTLPLGMTLSKVSDQPVAVQHSIREFIQVLAEAVIIVLLVSFFSLGFRTGLVVAFSIPLVLAMTFAGMHLFDVGLHKISLGALILALGLLVDDAIIAVEMMAIKMEQGYSRLKAAGFAWKTTAFPMLTGTLITAAGFLPIATASSSTGEYTRSIFQVVTIALVVSWIAAVVFVPYLGEKLLPDFSHTPQRAPWYQRFWAKLRRQPEPQPVPYDHGHDPYQTRFYQAFRHAVDTCVSYRKTVIVVTIGLFVGAVLLFKLVPQQFFPPSNRAEILVDIKLEEGASLTATEQAAKKSSSFWRNNRASIIMWPMSVQGHHAFIYHSINSFHRPVLPSLWCWLRHLKTAIRFAIHLSERLNYYCHTPEREYRYLKMAHPWAIPSSIVFREKIRIWYVTGRKK